MGSFLRLSNELKAQGVGQIVISHDGEIIRTLADRVFCLRDGEAVVSTTDEFIAANNAADVVALPGEWDLS